MQNFTYYNPVKIVFGKDSIADLFRLVPADRKIMMIYGGGSIKRNGVYDQVYAAMKDFDMIEFGGIEPNPTYETCIEAVEKIRKEQVDYLLAIGGGSVADATKFIAAAAVFPGDDLWEICASWGRVITDALPFGCVLTLPATGSEMNEGAVISRKSTREKQPIGHSKLFPQFSILDPQTTYSVPQAQLRNGLVDTYIHVLEQYVTYDWHTPLQDRQAEAILETLIEITPHIREDYHNYDVRADFMWCATQALNGLIRCGTTTAFPAHEIGHQLTGFFGLAHAESIAVTLSALWKHQKANKRDKLAQYATRIWKITHGSNDEKADVAIAKTVEYFHSIGMPTTLGHYNVTLKDIQKVVDRFEEKKWVIGELQNIKAKQVGEILALCF